MVLNYTNLTSSNDIFGITRYVMNDATNGVMGVLTIVALFVICFIALKAYSTKHAFAASAFITLIATLLLRAIDLVPDLALYVSIIGVAIGVVLLLTDR